MKFSIGQVVLNFLGLVVFLAICVLLFSVIPSAL